MIDASALKEHYDQAGFVLIESLFRTSEIQKLQQASDMLIEESIQFVYLKNGHLELLQIYQV